MYQDRIRFYRIHLESLSGPEFSRDLSVEIMNDTARNLVIFHKNWELIELSTNWVIYHKNWEIIELSTNLVIYHKNWELIELSTNWVMCLVGHRIPCLCY